MKVKINYKAAALAKSPNLYEKEENGQIQIILPTKSGLHPIASSNNSDSSWRKAAAFFGITK